MEKKDNLRSGHVYNLSSYRNTVIQYGCRDMIMISSSQNCPYVIDIRNIICQNIHILTVLPMPVCCWTKNKCQHQPQIAIID